MKLTDDMKRVVLQQRLGFVATVSREGRPNLSPKGTTTVFDDEHLMFADIASPTTVENLLTAPFVEINVVDPIKRKGYRFKGRGSVHSGGDVFERGVAVLEELGYTTDRSTIRSIVLVDVETAAPIISPAYATGATEDELTASWLRRFNELNK